MAGKKNKDNTIHFTLLFDGEYRRFLSLKPGSDGSVFIHPRNLEFNDPDLERQERIEFSKISLHKTKNTSEYFIKYEVKTENFEQPDSSVMISKCLSGKWMDWAFAPSISYISRHEKPFKLSRGREIRVSDYDFAPYICFYLIYATEVGSKPKFMQELPLVHKVVECGSFSIIVSVGLFLESALETVSQVLQSTSYQVRYGEKINEGIEKKTRTSPNDSQMIPESLKVIQRIREDLYRRIVHRKFSNRALPKEIQDSIWYRLSYFMNHPPISDRVGSLYLIDPK